MTQADPFRKPDLQGVRGVFPKPQPPPGFTTDR
jgi:hypothetical protein